MTPPGPLSSSFEAFLIASADGEVRLLVGGHLLVLDPDDVVSIEVVDAPAGLAVGRARAVRVELRAGAALRALRAAPDLEVQLWDGARPFAMVTRQHRQFTLGAGFAAKEQAFLEARGIVRP